MTIQIMTLKMALHKSRASTSTVDSISFAVFNTSDHKPEKYLVAIEKYKALGLCVLCPCVSVCQALDVPTALNVVKVDATST